LKYFTES